MSSQILVSRAEPSAIRKPEPGKGEQVSLNAVIREVIQQIQDHHKDLRLVFRCEPLPSIRGEVCSIQTLLEGLIRLIIPKGKSESRLFLYINSAGREEKMVTLQFLTNITTGPEWYQQNRPAIQSSAQLATANHCVLIVNEIKSTGCIFSLSFPVK